jgi:hypothetical protein
MAIEGSKRIPVAGRGKSQLSRALLLLASTHPAFIFSLVCTDLDMVSPDAAKKFHVASDNLSLRRELIHGLR